MSVQVNGVFKGGGAKGIAYAGALRACEDNDIEFCAVAGSSAGAITASLVASGYRSEDLDKMMVEALGAIDSPLSATPRLWRSSLLSADRLETWLDGVLRARVPTDSASPTFADVRSATGIELYVVAMDLASGQPIVFCPRLTPSTPVSTAVVASSAIPVAFPPQRFLVDDEIRRFIDGGTWANYPSFVFTDVDFRSFHGMELGNDVPTLGFVLGTTSIHHVSGTAPVPVPGGRLGSDRGAAPRELGVAGSIAASSMARAGLVIAPLLFGLLVSSWLRTQAEAQFAAFERLPDALEHLALVVSIALAGVVTVSLAGVALLGGRLGADIPDTGAVGARAAMGVGPSVPYWTGRGFGASRHHVIRIPVPSGLGTLTFRPSDALIASAVASGYAAASSTIASELSTAGRVGSVPTWDPPVAADSPNVALRPPLLGRIRRWGFMAASGVVVLGLWWLSLLVARRMTNGDSALLPMLGTAASSLVLIVLASSRRALDNGAPNDLFRRSSTVRVVWIAVGSGLASLILIAGVIFSTRYSVVASLNAPVVNGAVVAVDDQDSYSWVSVDLPTVAEIDRIRTLPNGWITDCDVTPSCLRLHSQSSGWSVGQTAAVRVDTERGVATLDRDIWNTEYWNAGGWFVVPAFFLLSLSLRSSATARRRHQLAKATMRTSTPAAASEARQRESDRDRRV